MNDLKEQHQDLYRRTESPIFETKISNNRQQTVANRNIEI